MTKFKVPSQATPQFLPLHIQIPPLIVVIASSATFCAGHIYRIIIVQFHPLSSYFAHPPRLFPIKFDKLHSATPTVHLMNLPP